MNRIETPFIVFGPSKSGTTWLQRLLNDTKKIRCHFQVPIFPLSQTEKKDLMGNKQVAFSDRKSPFAKLFASEAEEKEYYAMNRFLHDIPINMSGFFSKYITKGFEEEQTKWALRIQKAVVKELVWSGMGEEVLSVGTKAYTNLNNYFQCYPDGRAICITRDVRDVAVSKRYHSLRRGTRFNSDFKSGIKKAGNKYLPNWLYSPVLEDFLSTEELEAKNLIITPAVIDAYAGDWYRVMKYINRFKHDERVLLVRFEDLKLRYESTFTTILRHLKLNEAVIEDLSRFQPEVPKFGGNSSFFRKGEIGDWKNYFKPSDLDYLRKMDNGFSSHFDYVI